MSKSRKDSDDVRNSTTHKLARVASPGKLTNTVLLTFRTRSGRSNIKRCSNNKRAFCEILFFSTEKNKIKKFPTKMKRKIGALEGRVLYGAPKGARILPYSVPYSHK